MSMNINIPFSCGDVVYAVRPKNMYNNESYIYKGIVIYIKVEIDRDNKAKIMAHVRDLNEALSVPNIIYQNSDSIYATLDEAKSANPDVLTKI